MKALLALVATLLLGTCSQPPPLLTQILAHGELRVATRNSPDAYYLGSHGPEGLAYELASRFAESLGVSLRLYTVRTREAAINEVRAGRAHLAAAGLSTGIELPEWRDVRPRVPAGPRAPGPAARGAPPLVHEAAAGAGSKWPRAAPTCARSRNCGCGSRTSPGSNAATPTPSRS